MSIYDSYLGRIGQSGNSERERIINQSKRDLLNKSPASPSYRVALVNDVEKYILFYKGTSNIEKTFVSMPNSVLHIGDIMLIDNNHWLVISADLDYADTLTGKALLCQTQLKWQDDCNKIIEKWCSISVNSKSDINENNKIDSSKREFIIKLPYDNDTKKLDLGKRFIMETIGNESKAYKIIYVDMLSQVFDTDNSIITLVVEKDEIDKSTDNLENMIADYKDTDEIIEENKYCDIQYNGDLVLKIGGSYKTFKPIFYNEGIVDNTIVPTWNYTSDNADKFIVMFDKDNIKIKALDTLDGDETISLTLSEETSTYSAKTISLKAVFNI